MWMMAMRVSEAGEEWAKLRKEALKVVEGVEGLVMGDVSVPSPPPAPAVYEEDEEDEEEDVEGEKKRNAATLDPPPLKKRKLGLAKPVGIYEPHANIIHCKSSPPSSFFAPESKLLCRSRRHAANTKSLAATTGLCYEEGSFGWGQGG